MKPKFSVFLVVALMLVAMCFLTGPVAACPPAVGQFFAPQQFVAPQAFSYAPQQFVAPVQQFMAPVQQFAAPTYGYAAPVQQFAAPVQAFSSGYGVQQFAAPQAFVSTGHVFGRSAFRSPVVVRQQFRAPVQAFAAPVVVGGSVINQSKTVNRGLFRSSTTFRQQIVQ